MRACACATKDRGATSTSAAPSEEEPTQDLESDYGCVSLRRRIVQPFSAPLNASPASSMRVQYGSSYHARFDMMLVHTPDVPQVSLPPLLEKVPPVYSAFSGVKSGSLAKGKPRSRIPVCSGCKPYYVHYSHWEIHCCLILLEGETSYVHTAVSSARPTRRLQDTMSGKLVYATCVTSPG